MNSKLKEEFYLNKDVVMVARNLLGKLLVTKLDGQLCKSMIVETEAYSQQEKGCHAHKGRTPRNAPMFQKGGCTYVYLCYGIHHMFNVVTNLEGVAEAVLIRAVQPLQGAEWMIQRTGAKSLTRITSGPGKLCRALGISGQLNNQSLAGDLIWIEDAGIKVSHHKIIAAKRIGIDYAGADAELLWRFSIDANQWVSK